MLDHTPPTLHQTKGVQVQDRGEFLNNRGVMHYNALANIVKHSATISAFKNSLDDIPKQNRQQFDRSTKVQQEMTTGA